MGQHTDANAMVDHAAEIVEAVDLGAHSEIAVYLIALLVISEYGKAFCCRHTRLCAFR